MATDRDDADEWPPNVSSSSSGQAPRSETAAAIIEAAAAVYEAWDEDRSHVNKMFALGKTLFDAGLVRPRSERERPDSKDLRVARAWLFGFTRGRHTGDDEDSLARAFAAHRTKYGSDDFTDLAKRAKEEFESALAPLKRGREAP